jgi:hypothetical protein
VGAENFSRFTACSSLESSPSLAKVGFFCSDSLPSPFLTVSGTSSAFNLRFIVGTVRCNPFGAPHEFELEKFGFCQGGEVTGIAVNPDSLF